jgi:hypothetical protein
MTRCEWRGKETQHVEQRAAYTLRGSLVSFDSHNPNHKYSYSFDYFKNQFCRTRADFRAVELCDDCLDRLGPQVDHEWCSRCK